jgi:lipoate-protein ligase B
MTGVWVGERKIGAVGVKISHGITYHGLALNVDTDLDYFASIVPCGIADKEVTSMERELRRPVELQLVAACLVDEFAAHFQYMHMHLLPDVVRLLTKGDELK